MKIALVDASVKPLSKKKTKCTRMPRGFIPCLDLMKVFTYCKKEHLDVRMLIYRDELEDLTKYNVIVVSSENPGSAIDPAIESFLVGYRNYICEKTVFESIYDGHEGPDICIVSRNFKLPFDKGKLLGPVIDAYPGDIDAYGEMLYVRRKLDMIGIRAKERFIDMAYGRIMLEDERWMGPTQMAMYSGTYNVEITDQDPTSIPEDILVQFLQKAVENKMRVQFRHPLDITKVSPAIIKAMEGMKVLHDITFSNYSKDMKGRLLDVAESVGRRKIRLMIDHVGKDAVGEDGHFKTIRDLVLMMYECDRNRYFYKINLDINARTSRYGPLYVAITQWRMSGPVPNMMTMWDYLEWVKDEKTRRTNCPGGTSQDATSLAQAFGEAYPDVMKLMQNYTLVAVSKGLCVYEGEIDV